MSVIATAVKHMLAAGVPADAIVAAVSEMEEQITPPKSAAAIRQQRYRRRLGVHQSKWQELRNAVFERDEYRCVYCGADVSDNPQCDHVTPLASGGKSEPDNLVTACKPCNSSKRDLLVEQWSGVSDE